MPSGEESGIETDSCDLPPTAANTRLHTWQRILHGYQRDNVRGEFKMGALNDWGFLVFIFKA